MLKADESCKLNLVFAFILAKLTEKKNLVALYGSFGKCVKVGSTVLAASTVNVNFTGGIFNVHFTVGSILDGLYGSVNVVKLGCAVGICRSNLKSLCNSDGLILGSASVVIRIGCTALALAVNIAMLVSRLVLGLLFATVNALSVSEIMLVNVIGIGFATLALAVYEIVTMENALDVKGKIFTGNHRHCGCHENEKRDQTVESCSVVHWSVLFLFYLWVNPF